MHTTFLPVYPFVETRLFICSAVEFIWFRYATFFSLIVSLYSGRAMESSVAICPTYVSAPAGMFHSPKPWQVICVQEGLYSNRECSHCSQPSEIMMSAFVTSCTSFGDASKCAGQEPAGMMYEMVTFSGKRFFVKSASIELVQTMFTLLSAFAD